MNLINGASLAGRIRNRVESTLFRRYALPRTRREAISKKFIQKYLPPHPVVVDCGAHIGVDSLEMATMWPHSTVHAFEPVPDVFHRLRERTADVPNVVCHSVAISDRVGLQEMYVSGGSSDGSSSLLAPAEHLQDHPTVKFDEKISVPTTTFARWAEDQRVAQVDLFWLDMQGYELPAMEASRDLLRRASAVHTEVSTRSTYVGVRLYPEVRNWMEGEGFDVAVEAIPSGWDMGNVLFVRRELLT